MSTVGSRDEAVFVLSSYPRWKIYKAALHSFAEARERFEAAPERDTALRVEAARHSRAALQDGDAVQQQIMNLRRRNLL